MSLNGSAQSIGSPSRMRGKEGDELGLGQTIRITPAYAGKSPAIMVCSLEYWGSPPRMRGKGGFGFPVGLSLGITPACAGKRSPGIAFSVPLWDHPRVCGEKADSLVLEGLLEGSPPRVRGKVVDYRAEYTAVGITPACAGKSCPPQAPTFTRQDHPRVYGEKIRRFSSARSKRGSPPRVRGKAAGRDDGSCNHGITPACAGKSPWYVRDRCCPWGSPPRMRGKVFEQVYTRIPFRITPACAGKSSWP